MKRTLMIFTIIALVTICLGSAFGMDLDEFRNLLDQFRNNSSEDLGNEARIGPRSRECLQRISELRRVKYKTKEYPLELGWVAEVVAAIDAEPYPKLRIKAYNNLLDTLSGLYNDIVQSEVKHLRPRDEILKAFETVKKNVHPVQLPGNSANTGNCANTCIECDENVAKVELVSRSQQQSFSSSSSSSHGTGSGSSGNSSFHGSFSSHSGSTYSSGSYGGSTTSSTGQSHGTSHSTSSGSTSSTSSRSTSTDNRHTSSAHTPSNRLTTRENRREEAAPKRPTTQPREIKKPDPPKLPPPQPPKPKVQQPSGSNLKAILKILYYGIIILCILGFIFLIYYVISNIIKNVGKVDEKILLGQSALSDERTEAERLYKSALEAATASDYVKAVRILTLACLILLEERKFMGFSDSLTNGEYLRELTDRKDLHGLFDRPLNLFDSLVYGFKKTSKKEYEVFLSLYSRLIDLPK